MTQELDTLLTEVCACAYAAGQEVLRIYTTDFEKVEKEDGSPVTTADWAANDIIVKHLSYLTPDVPIVSEESVPEGIDASGDYWLVDPLDGTRSFVRRGDEFSVNIAYMKGGEPALGVIYIPIEDQMYAAINLPSKKVALKGKGAEATEPMKARPMPKSGCVVVLGSRQSLQGKIKEYLEDYPDYEPQYVSSAIKFCRIAEGAADLYLRTMGTYEWDSAAGQVLIESAGGSVKDWDSGERLAYGKPSWKNGEFIASGKE